MNADQSAILLSEIHSCRKCAGLLSLEYVDQARNSDERVEPRPIAPEIRKYPIFLIGQAPGLTEYEKRASFQGPAGQAIRKVFAEVGVPGAKFDDLVYSTAIVKCFPGSKPHEVGRTREDKPPCSQMVRNCLPFLIKQKQLVQPDVVVTLGKFPLRHYLRLRGRPPSHKLEDFVGTEDKWEGSLVIFFPHTSGKSHWFNDPRNRDLFTQAKLMLRWALLDRGIVG